MLSSLFPDQAGHAPPKLGRRPSSRHRRRRVETGGLDPRRRCVEQSVRNELQIDRGVPSGPLFTLFARNVIQERRTSLWHLLEEVGRIDVLRELDVRRVQARRFVRTTWAVLVRMRGLVKIEGEAANASERGDADAMYAAYAPLEHWRPAESFRSFNAPEPVSNASSPSTAAHVARLHEERERLEQALTVGQRDRLTAVMSYKSSREDTLRNTRGVQMRLARLDEVTRRVEDLEVGWGLRAA